ncbi:MAG TPA: penicillin-insensitive murein endopeptidase [Clostridia bacterium]|nr:penicillin-insensitive murein endopeptidase [Clostridia bacterium]
MPRPSRHLVRPLAALVAGLLLAVVAAGSAAAFPSTYPGQSLGNRGTDVRALQYLLRAHGETNPVDGIFAESTQLAVAVHQRTQGLPVTGIVDAATWRSLTPDLRPGSSGLAVRALQWLLNEKRAAGLTMDNVYAETTRAAVSAFQKHVGGTVTGVVNAVTWQRLLWHFDLPAFTARTGLCDYSVGNGRANWGAASAIGQLERAGRRVAAGGHGRVAVGDIGHEHGGDIAGHETHEHGLDVDVRPMRTAGNQCTIGVSFRSTAYDRAATRELVRAIRAAAPGHVKLIWFNDPVLMREGLTTHHAGHDDHLHVRYCDAGHPLPAYRCAAAALPAGAGSTPGGTAGPDGEDLTGPLLDPTVALTGLFFERSPLVGFNVTAAAISAFLH